MVAASAIPDRVPLGFICGYPVGPGGELYGGDMFLRSAAPDTLQGRAIQQVNETWGALHMKQEEVDDILNKRRARGRSYKGSSDLYIGIPVCKKKYTPFQIKRSVINTSPSGRVSVSVSVERMYGCRCHSELRRKVIERHGERVGWEKFGQWSLAKAKASAIRAVRTDVRKNIPQTLSKCVSSSSLSSCSIESRKRLHSEIQNSVCLNSSEPLRTSGKKIKVSQQQRFDGVCRNGSCLYKTVDEYDDIGLEIDSDSLVETFVSISRSLSPALDSTPEKGKIQEEIVKLDSIEENHTVNEKVFASTLQVCSPSPPATPISLRQRRKIIKRPGCREGCVQPWKCLSC